MTAATAGRAYAFGGLLLFTTLVFVAWLPVLLGVALLLLSMWAGHRVVRGEWVVPLLTDWLRAET